MSFGLIVNNQLGENTLNTSTQTTLSILNTFVSTQSGFISMIIPELNKCFGFVISEGLSDNNIASVTISSTGVSWSFPKPLSSPRPLVVWRIK